MAFSFDWTPLGAVGHLAAKAGRNQAAREEGQFNLAVRGQNLTDARARDEMRMREGQSQRGFKLQLAESTRQDRALDMRAKSMSQDASKYQEARTTRDTNLKDWESIRDTLQPDEYTRGLIAIRAGNVPPQLSSAQVKAQSLTDDIDTMRKVEMTAKGYNDILDGFYFDTSKNVWMRRDPGWGGFNDNEVVDPVQLQQLNQAREGMETLSQISKISRASVNARMQAEYDAPNATNTQKLKSQVTQIMSSISDTEQQKVATLIQLYTKQAGDDPDVGMQTYLDKYNAALEKQRQEESAQGTKPRGYVRPAQGGRMY